MVTLCKSDLFHEIMFFHSNKKWKCSCHFIRGLLGILQISLSDENYSDHVTKKSKGSKDLASTAI